MKTSKTPGVGTANWAYLLMIVLVYGASRLLIPLIGSGANLWVNELLWLLGLALIIAWFRGYSFRETFSTKRPRKGVLFPATVIGLFAWFPAVFISRMIEQALTLNVGPLPAAETDFTVSQIFFLITGLIILAPFCEEFFFRGLMQKAYDGYNKKYSWLIVGVLFGVFHIGNGLSSVFSATLLGALMGYLLFVTNSIWPSMVLHAFNNLMAVSLGPAVMNLGTGGPVPAWFVVMMLTGILVTWISLKAIRKRYSGSDENTFAVAAHADASDDGHTNPKPFRFSTLYAMPLILAATIFVGAGVYEIGLRSNTMPTGAVDSGHTRLSIGKSNTDSPLRLVEFELHDQRIHTFEWKKDYKVSYMDATFKLIGPDGSVHHNEGPVFGKDLTVDSWKQQSTISGEGRWEMVIAGELEDFEIDITWTLKKLLKAAE